MKKTIIIAVVAAMALWGGIAKYHHKPQPFVQHFSFGPTKEVGSVDNFQPSQEIVGLALEVGLTAQDMVDTHAQIGVGQGPNICDPKYFAACYDPNTKTIHLYESTFTTPDEDPATNLAYEYSHYVWQIMPQAERDMLIPDMNSWYLTHRATVDAQYGDLERIEGGYGTPEFENELHSTICTQVRDSELSPALLAHCSSYLPNRNVLVNVF